MSNESFLFFGLPRASQRQAGVRFFDTNFHGLNRLKKSAYLRLKKVDTNYSN